MWTRRVKMDRSKSETIKKIGKGISERLAPTVDEAAPEELTRLLDEIRRQEGKASPKTSDETPRQ